MWRRPRPTANCAAEAALGACSWPTSPVGRLGERAARPRGPPTRARAALRALQRRPPHHGGPAAAPSPTPRPRPRLHARAERSPRRRDTLGPASRPTPSWYPLGAGRRPRTGRSPVFVVAHVPFAALVRLRHRARSAGELEGHGLIDCETVQRIACDATVAVAVDDDVGHTMYEGRARRFPTRGPAPRGQEKDRHCRSRAVERDLRPRAPLRPRGKPEEEPTCPNLVLLCCKHHHGPGAPRVVWTDDRQRAMSELDLRRPRAAGS